MRSGLKYLSVYMAIGELFGFVVIILMIFFGGPELIGRCYLSLDVVTLLIKRLDLAVWRAASAHCPK